MKKRRAANTTPPRASTRAAPSGRRLEAGIVLALAAYLLLQYGSALRTPFINDDYLFLTRVRNASPGALVAPNTLVSHYYRPWSRELHYWTLQTLFGPSAPVFHVANLALWLVAMWIFFRIAAETAGLRGAVVATLGSALVAAWATPILWAAGSQDLWMIATGLGFLWCSIHERRIPAAVLLATSLLSKETAVVFPAIATTHQWIVGRRRPFDALRATWPSWLVVGIWAALHPMLGGSWARPDSSGSPSTGAPWAANLVRSALAVLSLDAWPKPEHGLGGVLVTALPGALVLAAIAWWALSTRASHEPQVIDPPGAGRAPIARVARWGLLWWALGWLPTMPPGIGWQPYYGLVGILGAWLAIGAGVQRWRGLSLATILVVAVLRSAYAQTPQAILGSEWHQRRLAALTRQMRDDLLRLRPAIPPHSRVYFGDVPWGLGLITSHPDSPALRAWYSDSTLSGGFYSQVRPRSVAETRGDDLFFLFDRATGHLVEVVKGPEPLAAGRVLSPRWERDHFYLARQLFESGDPWPASSNGGSSSASFRSGTTTLTTSPSPGRAPGSRIPRPRGIAGPPP